MPDLKKLHDAQGRLEEATTAMDNARDDRDAMIHELNTEGVTAYRLAKELGISQQAVAKILRKFDTDNA